MNGCHNNEESYDVVPEFCEQFHLLPPLLQLLLLGEESVQQVLVLPALALLPASTRVQLPDKRGVLTSSLALLRGMALDIYFGTGTTH